MFALFCFITSLTLFLLYFFLTKESGPDVISLSSDSSNDDDVGDDIQSEIQGVEINQDGEEVEIVGESTTEITSKVLQHLSLTWSPRKPL